MSTYITLEDGRIWSCSDGQFDYLLQLTAQELEHPEEPVAGLGEWLLAQRCSIQGPGVGYLDVRELSPSARTAFTRAAQRALRKEREAEENAQDPDVFLVAFGHYLLLLRMWEAVARGESPEILTAEYIEISEYDGKKRGPGW